MKNIEKQLSEYLGFSNKKTQVYLALLELGETTVIDIAKKANLKRSTVYNFLPELLQDGLIKKTSRKGKRFFFIEDPKTIKNRLEEKTRGFTSLLPELKALHNIISTKPKVTFYEGVGGLKDIYTDIIKSSNQGDIISTTLGLTKFSNTIPKEIVDYYINERIRRKIKIQIIATESKMANEMQKNSQRELREIKIVKDNDFQYDADMKIYSNKVAFISYSENFIGVIIESKEINQMQKSSFNLLWKLLPEI